MSSFKSEKIIVRKNEEELFKILTKFENLKKILPSNIEKFEVSGEICVLKVTNLPQITLEINDKISYKFISYSASQSPIPFLIKSYIEKIDEISCHLIFEIDIELNMMTKIMLDKPIKNFIKQISNAASKLS